MWGIGVDESSKNSNVIVLGKESNAVTKRITNVVIFKDISFFSIMKSEALLLYANPLINHASPTPHPFRYPLPPAVQFIILIHYDTLLIIKTQMLFRSVYPSSTVKKILHALPNFPYLSPAN